MQKIHIEYIVLVLAVFFTALCAGCGNGSALAGAPPGNYVAVCTNIMPDVFTGQETTNIETNTWEFSPGGNFRWAERPIMPFEGTYRVNGRRVLLSFNDLHGNLVKDVWYFDISATGLEGHSSDPDATNGCQHLTKIR